MDEIKKVKIGDICNIVKGITGIQSAEPGEYPLVTTGAERKTCSSYQFDTEAVCIPLVSSTGHGSKTLNYVHYQKGKFALGSILCALIPKKENIIDVQFLHQYLMFYKDLLLVPLMKGAANVSLSPTAISNIEIPLLDLDEQHKMANLLVLIQAKEVLLKETFDNQNKLLLKFIENIIYDGILGKLTNKQPEISSSWEWKTLNDIAELNGGYSFKSENYTEKGIRVIRISDFNESGFINNKIVRHVYSSELDNFKLEINDIVLAMTGGTVGKSYLIESLSEDMYTNQRVCTIKAFNINPKFLNYVIKSKLIQKQIHEGKNSSNDNISLTQLRNFLIPIPSEEEQDKIVSKIDSLLEIIYSIQDNVLSNKTNVSKCLRSIFLNNFKNIL